MSGRMNKEEATSWLIERHFAVEPDLSAVYRIVGPNEDSPDEPIKLLEVNAATVATGSIEPFGFAPTREVPFPVVIAEITPTELESFQAHPEALPRGWDLETALVIRRPRAA